MLTPSQVKTAIVIGKYGACLPACSGSIILGHFNLAGCRVIIRPAQRQEGATIPMAPGEIQNLYQPVQDQPGWWTRVDDPAAAPKQLIEIKVTFNDKEYDKYVMMSKSTRDRSVRIANFINTTEQRLKAVASNLKHVPTRAVVTVKNFVKKWWS